MLIWALAGAFVALVVGTLLGFGWGLSFGLRNARDIALQAPAAPVSGFLPPQREASTRYGS